MNLVKKSLRTGFEWAERALGLVFSDAWNPLFNLGALGFFYYWVGKDYRGQGLGGEAVSLLLTVGSEYLGIECCYAKIYEYNKSSQNGIKKLGFERLPFNAAPPNETEQLYYLGCKKSAEENALECQQLFNDMDSSTKVDMPLLMELSLG